MFELRIHFKSLFRNSIIRKNILDYNVDADQVGIVKIYYKQQVKDKIIEKEVYITKDSLEGFSIKNEREVIENVSKV